MELAEVGRGTALLVFFAGLSARVCVNARNRPVACTRARDFFSRSFAPTPLLTPLSLSCFLFSPFNIVQLKLSFLFLSPPACNINFTLVQRLLVNFTATAVTPPSALFFFSRAESFVRLSDFFFARNAREEDRRLTSRQIFANILSV